MPETLTGVGSFYVFFGCDGLKTVVLPDGLDLKASHMDAALACCPALETVRVIENNERYKIVDDVLFTKDGKTLVLCPAAKSGEYTIPDGTETILTYAFINTGITALNIPDSVRTISEEAFSGEYFGIGCSSLCRITFGNGLKDVSSSSFAHIGFLADGKNISVTAENLKGKTFTVCGGTLDTGFKPEVSIEGHDLDDIKETPAGCTTDGEKAHQHCAACNKDFIDGKEVSAEQLVEKAGHSMTYKEKTDSTCTKDGNVEYWYCSACKKYFSDADGKTEITDITIKAGHSMTHKDAVLVGCTTDGNVEYWYCSACKKYFSDEAGTSEITTDVTLTKTGHKMGHKDAVPAGCTTDGNVEYWYCSKCEK